MLGAVCAHGQWVAFNDHFSGPGTHTNTTRYNVFGFEDGTNGPLKDVATGAILPVQLTISRSGLLSSDQVGVEPALGTPLQRLFTGYVSFVSTNSPNNVGIGSSGLVTYHFTGLDAAKRYNLAGGAVRGNATFSNRWALFSLDGAESFASYHTGGDLTHVEVPSLAPNQVAINTGANHTPETGDLFDWRDIDPGPDGSVSITCTRYGGPLPNGLSPGPAGYALTAFRLEEAVPAPVQILSNPVDQSVNLGDAATFFVLASGYPLHYQWVVNGMPLPGETNDFLIFSQTTEGDSGSRISVAVSNQFNSLISSEAVLNLVFPTLDLLSFSQPWRFEASGVDLGTAWKEENYDDRGWPSGPGPLGFEDGALPEPLRTSLINNNQTTYYFRTAFQLPREPRDFQLILTNLIDDGAVFYLNGTEILRMHMPAGPVQFNTEAALPAVGYAVFQTVSLDGSSFRGGSNVLAVEVHQAGTASSDLVFGAALAALPFPPTVLTITNQPRSIMVQELQSARLTVGVAGSGAYYQWYHNGEPIAGATHPSYEISRAHFTDDGSYYVEASNVFGVLSSDVVTMTVLIDSTPPVVVQADGSRATDLVMVSFSEPVTLASATNLANYQITNTLGAEVEILSAELSDGTNVLLTTGPRASTINSILSVRGIQDLSSQSNIIAPGAIAAISILLPIIGFGDWWEFYDPVPGLDALDLGTDWRQPGYNTDSWGTGPAAFVFDLTGQTFPVPRGTTLSAGKIITYFRYRFDYPGDAMGGWIRLRHLVDDGAVFYLNGQEIRRFNLPEGPVDFSTPAPVSIGNAGIVEEEEFFSSALHSGPNVLAVELHQTSTNDLDAAFAAELNVAAPSLANGPVYITEPPLDQTVVEGQPATFEFQAMGVRSLQWFRNGEPVSGATNAVWQLPATPLDFDQAVIQVRVSNAESSQLSEEAIMTVLPDMEPPTLESAYLRDGLIQVTFSEPVEAGSATSLDHFSLVSQAGEPLAITGVELVGDNAVLLSTSSQPAVGDVVRVQGVTDNSRAKNLILSGNGASLGALDVPLVPIDATWLYNQPGYDLGPNWWNSDYEDSSWPSGPALLGHEIAPLPEPIRTALELPSSVDEVTSYFRTRFHYPVESASTDLRIRHIIDDGVVVYLNGMEIYRLGVIEGQNYQSFASRSVGNAVSEGPFLVTVNSLHQGENVLAAELHQASVANSDVVFGLELIAPTIPSILLPPPAALQISRHLDELDISWPAPNYILEETDILEGPDTDWRPVPDAVNPYHAPISSSLHFFRLRQVP
jgi:hypothetical protein